MEITVQLEQGPLRPRQQRENTARDKRGEVPKITRMLVLAHRIEGTIEEGRARDYAAVARSLCLTRARLTQIMNLLLLSPSIQEIILTQADRVRHLSERQLRAITRKVDRDEQAQHFERMLADA